MNLLDLFVKIGVEDDASGEVENISNNIIGNLGQAAMTAGKALAGMFAVKQVVDFGRAAFDAYSEFEQLAGGAEKIFDEIDQSKILNDANGAWRTLNMSANEYLAAINQTGAMFAQTMGDEAGYETAKKGMQAISDYATGTGKDINELNDKFSAITRSTSSYQSIADQFAGILPATSADFLEQAQAAGLLSDSYEKLTDVPVAEYQQAVSGMLEKGVADLGLAGNTSKEALSTISGSILATKSAWQNLVTEFGKPDADIGARIGDMFTAVFGENGEGGVVRNVINEVGVIATNMINAVRDGISSGIDWIANNGARMVLNAVRGIVSTMSDAASNISSFDLSKLFEGDGSDIGERLSKMVGDITEIFWEWSPDLMEAGSSLLSAIGESIATNGPVLLGKVGEILGSIGNFVLEHAPELVGKIAEAALTLGEWLTSQGPELVTKISEIIGMVVISARDWLVENGPLILEAVAQLLQNVLNAIAEHGPQIIYNIGETIGTIIGTVAAAASELFPAAVEFFGGLITGTSQEGEKLREWFAGLPETLLNAMGDLANFLFNAGEQIISGFWDGLTSKFSEVQDWVGGIGTWIAEHKGPKQYDLGLLVDNGMWIMDGLQRGLEKGLPSVEDTLSGITDTIRTGISASADVSVARGGNDDAILGMLASILNAIPNAVYLDGRALVGQLAPDMNAAMGVL